MFPIAAALLGGMALAALAGVGTVTAAGLWLVRFHGCPFLLAGVLSFLRTGLLAATFRLALLLLRRPDCGVHLLHLFHVQEVLVHVVLRSGLHFWRLLVPLIGVHPVAQSRDMHGVVVLDQHRIWELAGGFPLLNLLGLHLGIAVVGIEVAG